jgi:hypothetical protein
MPPRSGIEKHYIGKSGQFAAMSEFLWRGWNVAIPEVDEGDDIFVVQHTTGVLYRVQVKTATARERSGATEGQFSIASRQIASPRTPELHFVFCFRLVSGGWRFAAATQRRLTELLNSGKLGKENKRGELVFRLSWAGEKISIPVSRASMEDVTTSFYIDAWKLWENLRGG